MWSVGSGAIPMMRKTSTACGLLIAAAACGTPPSSGFPPGGVNGTSTSGNGSGGAGTVGSSNSGTPVGNNGSLGYITPASPIVDAGAGDGGELPDPNCPPGVHTSVSGLVYDPSFQDPLYNITVFAPKSAMLPVLPQGASVPLVRRALSVVLRKRRHRRDGTLQGRQRSARHERAPRGADGQVAQGIHDSDA
jgi:hypothetical protein